MNKSKKYYLRHPKLCISRIDTKFFNSYFSKNLIPKRCKCSFCGKKFFSYRIHGYVSSVPEKHNVTMGPRFSDCPYCRSVDKYRWLWRILSENTELLKSQGRLLHFAPEGPIKARIKNSFKGEYFTGDIEPGRAEYVVDMTDICFEDNSFDYIIACNVMEHIMDERKAVEELKRVIKPTGTIILSFPVAFDMEKTYEDDKITSEEERLENYGQEDHVRLYGIDYVKRFESYGLKVKSILPEDIMTRKEIYKNGFRKVTPMLLLQK